MSVLKVKDIPGLDEEVSMHFLFISKEHYTCFCCGSISGKYTSRDGFEFYCVSCSNALGYRAEPKDNWKYIKHQTVFCPSETCGCKVSGPIEDIVKHYSVCPLKLLPCGLCNSRICRNDYRNHVMLYCPKRDVYCLYCKEGHLADEDAEHIRYCKEWPYKCSYCTARFYNDTETEEHQASCVQKPRPCSFVDFGCSFTGNREEVLAHVADTEHSDLVVRYVGKQIDEERRQFNESVSKQEEDYKNEINDLKAKVTELEKLLSRE